MRPPVRSAILRRVSTPGEALISFKREQLRYFLTVAEEGQITRAAVKLNLAQPALSQSINNLEARVGFRLLDRHARGVSLTPAGEAFLIKARLVIETSDDLDRTVEAMERSVTGTIAFGYAALPPWQATPELVEAFTAAYPAVKMDLKALSFPRAPASRWLADVDVTLASTLTDDPGIWVQPVRWDQRAVVVSSGHPLVGRGAVTVAEVVDETFIALDPACDPVWAAFWTLDNDRGGPPSRMSHNPSASAQERFAMIASGQGITVSSLAHAQLIESSMPGVSAITISDAERVPMSLVGRKDRLSPAVEGLREVAARLTADLDADGADPALAGAL